MNNEPMDEKALEILLTDYRFYRGELRTSTPENFEYAKSKGLMFDNIRLSHNQSIDWLFEIRKTISKAKAVNLFLASLTNGKNDWRSVLPAYAASRFFPEHSFVGSGNEHVCNICGDYSFNEFEERNLNLINQFRLYTGGLLWIGMGAINLAFYLQQAVEMPEIKCSNKDIEILSEIVKIIKNAEDKDKPNDLVKKINKSKVIKANKVEIRGLLESLAILGIVETNEHKGFYNSYIDYPTREQRQRRDNWGYPLRWWNGIDKINNESLNFWFNI